MTTTPIATDELVRALVGRVIQLFGLTVQAEYILVDAAFIGQGEVSIGGHELDSMDLLEILVTLEGELGVALVDDIDLDQLSTLRAFADHAGRKAPADALAAFVERWAIEGVPLTVGTAG